MTPVHAEAEKNIRSAMESNIIKTVENIVKREASNDDWQFHIQPVIINSTTLGNLLNANLEVLTLAAILHDLGRIRYGKKDHPITGARDAEVILAKLEYPDALRSQVVRCIERHSKSTPKETLEEVILANADAMAHFDEAFYLVCFRATTMDFKNAVKKVKEQLESDWEIKMTLNEAKELIKEKRIAIEFILNQL